MKERSATASQLFVLRLWLEELGDGQVELRGQVRHVLSGEVRYFHEWSRLHAFVTQRLVSAPATDAKDGP